METVYKKAILKTAKEKYTQLEDFKISWCKKEKISNCVKFVRSVLYRMNDMSKEIIKFRDWNNTPSILKKKYKK